MTELTLADLGVVCGGIAINIPITTGHHNHVDAGKGDIGLNIPITFGDDNTVTTGRGPSLALTFGHDNTVLQA